MLGGDIGRMTPRFLAGATEEEKEEAWGRRLVAF